MTTHISQRSHQNIKEKAYESYKDDIIFIAGYADGYIMFPRGTNIDELMISLRNVVARRIYKYAFTSADGKKHVFVPRTKKVRKLLVEYGYKIDYEAGFLHKK